MTEPYDRLCRSLGHQFQDPSLLTTALSHRSIGSNNNERLEFLGDAILSYVISTKLYHLFPLSNEGKLSRYRANLVKGETLAKLGRELELGDYLILGSGELKSGGYRRDSILADAMEAIIGAVYLDAGIDAASALITKLYGDRIEQVTPDAKLKDPKTRLQEYLQSKRLPLPEYEVISTEGEAHNQTFIVSCSVDGLDSATEGVGSSRRKAEQSAAEEALKRLGHES